MKSFNSKVRTRYAPSPTGKLHIGGARTALFCYLFAKHYQGDFVIRLEDTDIAREVENGEASQLDNLAWLGVIADESPQNVNPKYAPYRQSERLDIYQKYLKKLIDQGFAYACYDTKEEIAKQADEQKRRGVYSFRYDRNWLKISEAEKTKRKQDKLVSYRLSLPKDKFYSWKDIVRGKISFNSKEISEFVIMKSNGMPTYNFANVIDDHLMEISHVFRGEEHISNTPKQLAIYEYLDWKPPRFGHFTIITNDAGKKLSKRDDSIKQFIEIYSQEGYVAHAIFNFLSLLGWSPKNTQEIKTKEQLIKEFDETRLSKSPSTFDIKKMNWMSNQYIKKMDFETLKTLALPQIKNLTKDRSEKWTNMFLLTYQKQISYAAELKSFLPIFENKFKLKPDQEAFVKSNIEVVKTFGKLLSQKEFNIENIKATIKETQQDIGIKGKNLFMPIRVALTGHEHGPELDKCIYLCGEKNISQRIKSWAQ